MDTDTANTLRGVAVAVTEFFDEDVQASQQATQLLAQLAQLNSA